MSYMSHMMLRVYARVHAPVRDPSGTSGTVGHRVDIAASLLSHMRFLLGHHLGHFSAS